MKCVCYMLAVSILLAGAAGCSYESRKTAVHEPGVYKGAKDELLTRQQEKQRQELVNRFKLVQADR